MGEKEAYIQFGPNEEKHCSKFFSRNFIYKKYNLDKNTPHLVYHNIIGTFYFKGRECITKEEYENYWKLQLLLKAIDKL
jgi:hypothetical protein